MNQNCELRLPVAILRVIDRDLVGKIGDNRIDVLATIIVAWLSEKKYFDRRGDI